MTPSHVVISLTVWLMTGLVANYLGWIGPDGTGVGWWLLMGIPGGIYAALLLGALAFTVIALYLAMLASRP